MLHCRLACKDNQRGSITVGRHSVSCMADVNLLAGEQTASSSGHNGVLARGDYRSEAGMQAAAMTVREAVHQSSTAAEPYLALQQLQTVSSCHRTGPGLDWHVLSRLGLRIPWHACNHSITVRGASLTSPSCSWIWIFLSSLTAPRPGPGHSRPLPWLPVRMTQLSMLGKCLCFSCLHQLFVRFAVQDAHLQQDEMHLNGCRSHLAQYHAP